MLWSTSFEPIKNPESGNFDSQTITMFLRNLPTPLHQMRHDIIKDMKLWKVHPVRPNLLAVRGREKPQLGLLIENIIHIYSHTEAQSPPFFPLELRGSFCLCWNFYWNTQVAHQSPPVDGETRLHHHSHPHAGSLGTTRSSDLREKICERCIQHVAQSFGSERESEAPIGASHWEYHSHIFTYVNKKSQISAV